MAYKDLTSGQRVIAVHLDIMKHKDFALMGGVTQIGKVTVGDEVPTAGTDGLDVWYNTAFVMEMTRKQLRYLVLHENWHKGLHHCTEYIHLHKKYPNESAQAVDYVVNGLIEETDPTFQFVERPTSIPPLVSDEFKDMSYPEVLKRLIDKKKEQQQPEPGEGTPGAGKPGDGEPGEGPGRPMDEHRLREPGTVPTEGQISPADLKQAVTDAINQGAIVRNKLRGVGGGGNALGGFQERQTDWRTPLRRFVQELCEGDEQSRFNPPNKRMLPLGIILPSHFSEATGELIVACDTSGSMTGILSTVFGEVARICQSVNPASVRVIWWGDHIEGEQVFKPQDYPQIAKLMKPKGGGGTTVSCVAQYVREKKYKPRATIYITDGYIESNYEVVAGPVLWGVVDFGGFVPIKGKVIHISSMGES